jgi:hypothetical protein
MGKKLPLAIMVKSIWEAAMSSRVSGRGDGIHRRNLPFAQRSARTDFERMLPREKRI